MEKNFKAKYLGGDPRLLEKNFSVELVIQRDNIELFRLEEGKERSQEKKLPLVRYPLLPLEVEIVKSRFLRKKQVLVVGDLPDCVVKSEFQFDELDHYEEFVQAFELARESLEKRTPIDDFIGSLGNALKIIPEEFVKLISQPLLLVQSTLDKIVEGATKSIDALSGTFSTEFPTLDLFRRRRLEVLNGNAKINCLDSSWKQEYDDGHSFFFLHPVGGNMMNWRSYYFRLHENDRVIGIDLRGHGKSWSKKREYNGKTYTEDLKEVWETLNPGKTILIAHSLSGFIALQLLLDDPDPVPDGLVLVSCALKSSKDLVKAAKWLPPPRLWAPWEKKIKDVAKAPTTGIFHEITPEEIKNDFLDDALRISNSVYYQSFKKLIPLNFEDKFENLEIPTLFLRGVGDNIVQESLYEQVHEIPKVNYIQVPRSAHMAPLEQHHEVIHRIMEFSRNLL